MRELGLRLTAGVAAVALTACTKLPFSSGAAPAPAPVQTIQTPTATITPVAPAPPPPPHTFVQTTSDVRATRILDVRDGMAKAALFRAVNDFLSQRFSIDVSDQRAGFLMTPWQAGTTAQGAPDLRYRTRLIVRFLGDDWKQASVRAEANWQRGDEWDIGFDLKLLDDISAELKNRIGKR